MSFLADIRLERSGFRLEASLAVGPGEVLGVYGPSGSGKTTLLRAIAGLERAVEGTVRLGDIWWQDSTRAAFVPAHHRGVVMVFQDANLFPHLTVRRNLEYGWRRIAGGGPRPDMHDVADRTGVTQLLNRYPRGLSGGERQRVALARALVARPNLLLMDEPLASLDDEAKAKLLPFLQQILAELDVPVIYVSHDLSELQRVTTRRIRLEKGRVVPAAPPPAGGPVPASTIPDSRWQTTFEPHHAVVPATVGEPDPLEGLVQLQADTGRCYVPLDSSLEPGERVLVQVPLHAATVGAAPPQGLGAVNTLTARVLWMADKGPGPLACGLEIAGQRVVLPVGRREARHLALGPGQTVWLTFPFVEGFRRRE